MAEIALTNGGVALVDDADLPALSGKGWFRSHNGYAVWDEKRGGRSTRHYMHRVILGGLPDGSEPDHINGDRLDNRRSNLRVATRQQNAMNKGPNRNNTTGYKGVTWDKSRGRFTAGVKVGYRRVNLGRFDTAEEAAHAYDAAAVRFHGEFAKVNFA